MAKHKSSKRIHCSCKIANLVSQFLYRKGHQPESQKFPDVAAATFRFLKQPAPFISRSKASEYILRFAISQGLAEQIVPNATYDGPIRPKFSPVLPPAKPTTAIMEPERTGFYWSDEWRRVRYAALRASRGVCEVCGNGPSPGKPLHVDHIRPRSLYPKLELELSNLQVMCCDCNLGKSNSDEIDWRKKDEEEKWAGGTRRVVGWKA